MIPEIRAQSTPKVFDGLGQAVPVQTRATSSTHGDLTEVDIALVAPAAGPAWYSMVVDPVPNRVTIVGADKLKLNLYTGNLVYLETLVRPKDPAKQDIVLLRFTQPVEFPLFGEMGAA